MSREKEKDGNKRRGLTLWSQPKLKYPSVMTRSYKMKRYNRK